MRRNINRDQKELAVIPIRSKSMKISLNIFTNCTKYAPSIEIISQCYKSFCRIFGNDIEKKIFMDVNPNQEKAEEYFKKLRDYFRCSHFIHTQSLSDGYIASINSSDSDYLFQLEHDWLFIADKINHSLFEICEIMERYNLYHFRFNKRQNIPAQWDKTLKEVDTGNMRFCITPNLSNNPHIINVKKYKDEILQHIKIKPGSKGIEEEINNQGQYFGCIYGGMNYEATVKHIDGRRLDRKRHG